MGLGYFLALVVVGYLGYHWWRNRHRLQISANSETLLIRLPKDNEVTIEAAEQMFDSIHALKLTEWEAFWQQPPAFTIEVVAKKEDIAFYVNLPRDLRDLIEKNIHAAYPEADITPVVSPNIWTKNGHTAFTKLRAKDDRVPIKTYKDLANDALQGLTSALSKMNTDEGAIVQFVIQPVGDRFRERILKQIERRRQEKSGEQTVTVSETESKQMQEMEKKVEKPLFKSIIRICVNSPEKTAAESHLKNIVASFAQFDTPLAAWNVGAWVPKNVL